MPDQKLIKNIFFLIMFFFSHSIYAEKNIFLVDKLAVASSVGGSIEHPDLPSSSVESFDSDNQVIFYYAKITVFNPSKKKYDIKMTCIDKKGQIFLKKKIKKSYSISAYQKKHPYLERSLIASFSLNPKPNAMVIDQLKPLVTDKEYFIKLYIDEKLIGITQFYYSIV